MIRAYTTCYRHPPPPDLPWHVFLDLVEQTGRVNNQEFVHMVRAVQLGAMRAFDGPGEVDFILETLMANDEH